MEREVCSPQWFFRKYKHADCRMTQDKGGWGTLKRTAYWVLKRREEVLDEKDGLCSACTIVFNYAIYSISCGFIWVREKRKHSKNVKSIGFL